MLREPAEQAQLGDQPHQHDAGDATVRTTNRRAFEKWFQIVTSAWLDDLLSIDGEFWQIPVSGTPWNVESTDRYGSGIANGEIVALGPVPKPLQGPG